MARNIVVWIWSPILMLIIAIVGALTELEPMLTVALMAVVLILGIGVAIVTAAERENEKMSDRIRQLSGYYTRRFGGESSYSIFANIRDLYRTQDPELWEYAHSCEQTERVYNSWCENFISRIETDSATGRFAAYIRRYLQELWMLNNLYHEYIEQFRDIAEKVELPTEIIEQYNRFAAEYNSFTNTFRELITSATKSGKTELEAHSVRDAIFVGTTSYSVPGLNTQAPPVQFNYAVTQPQIVNNPPPAPSAAPAYTTGAPGGYPPVYESSYRREYGGESYGERSERDEPVAKVKPKAAAPQKADPRDEYEAMRRANLEKRMGLRNKASTPKNDIPSEDEYSSIATPNEDDEDYRRFTY